MAWIKSGVAGYEVCSLLSQNLDAADEEVILDDEIKGKREGISVRADRAGESVCPKRHEEKVIRNDCEEDVCRIL